VTFHLRGPIPCLVCQHDEWVFSHLCDWVTGHTRRCLNLISHLTKQFCLGLILHWPNYLNITF
jgi:hypothetical protein